MLAIAGLLFFSLLIVDAQEFEVASVKPDRTESPFPGPLSDMMAFEGGPGTKDPGRIRYHGVSLKMLLARAYKVRPEQVSGPSWLGSERYTIEATLPAGTNAEQLRLMLQKLLIERFQITLRQEVKDTPVYRLKVAKGGPKLKPAEELPQYENEEERNKGLMQRAQANLEKMRATREANLRIGISTPSRSFGMARATVDKFAEMLARNLDRPVKDMTELEGEYSFHLEWTPDAELRDEGSGLSIFIAVQEQLGLRLEAANEPLELVVIEKAEKVPTSN